VTVNRRHDEDEDYEASPNRAYGGQRPPTPDQQDHEISLGTPTILGIFFALAVVCACFFGFGYSLGRKSAPAAPPPEDAAASTSSYNSPKPTAGSAYGPPATALRQPEAVIPPSSPAAGTVTVPLSPASNAKAVNPADAMIAGDKLPAAASKPTSGSQPPAAVFMVQVAAVSSQDVADILLASLQRKGYSVAVHHEPQDKLLHVQVGPFADRKEAEAMRQRVLADGFNAIVK
jgi:DedD protein